MYVKIDLTNIVLKTERLTLKLFEYSDLEDFYEYAKVSGVGESAGWNSHRSIDESARILESFIKTKNVFAIHKNADNGKCIGSFGFHSYDTKVFPEFDKKKVVMLGIVLAKNYWGKGLGTETLKHCLDFVFNHYDVDICLASAFNFNKASLRIQEKCGLKKYKTYTLVTSAQTAKATANIIKREDFFGK
ncbi:MAG: GNAT family protein [Treponemataceae bacterium]